MEDISKIKPPDSFSFDPEKWEFWKRRFMRYLIISGKSALSDEEKIHWLMYTMGEESEIILNELPEQPDTFEGAIKAFDQYFNPGKRKGSSRLSFHTRRQEKGEPVGKFITDLQKIATDCEFGAMRDELIRDKVIAEMRDTRLRDQLLLKDDLTLEETISIIKQAEQNKRHQEYFDVIDVNDERILTTNQDESYGRVILGHHEVSSTFDGFKESFGFSQTSLDFKEGTHVMTEGNGESETADNSFGSNFPVDNPANVSEQEMDVKSAECEESSNLNDINDSDNNISVEEMNLKEERQEEVESPSVFEDGDQNNPVPSTSSCNDTAETETVRGKQKKRKLSNFVDDNNTECQKSINDYLTDEILTNIFSNYLPSRYLIRIERVCKRWRDVSLKSWRNVESIDIRQDFNFKWRPISLDHLEKILVRSGQYITHLHCSFLAENATLLPARTSMEIISKYCKRLRDLNICNTWKERNYLDALDLNLVRNLTTLSIGNDVFSDDYLPVLLRNAVNLEEFFICGYDYPDNKLKRLSDKCKIISVPNSKRFSDTMLQELITKHPKMQHLDISNTRITPNALLPVANELESLALWEMKNFFQANLTILKALKCSNLRLLDLNYNRQFLTDEILSILVKNCRGIEDLRLKGAWNLSQASIENLKILKNLKHLDVSHTNIKVEQIASLVKKCKQLKKILYHGGWNGKKSGLISIIAASPKLGILSISSAKLSKSLVESALAAVEGRKNGIKLQISLKSKSPEKIPGAVKELNLENTIDCQSKSDVLRISYGTDKCDCKFYLPCSCIDEEETLLCFG